eukprot:scaffold144077_cov31-Tisochrysis_lutea.AAC.3
MIVGPPPFQAARHVAVDCDGDCSELLDKSRRMRGLRGEGVLDCPAYNDTKGDRFVDGHVPWMRQTGPARPSPNGRPVGMTQSVSHILNQRHKGARRSEAESAPSATAEERTKRSASCSGASLAEGVLCSGNAACKISTVRIVWLDAMRAIAPPAARRRVSVNGSKASRARESARRGASPSPRVRVRAATASAPALSRAFTPVWPGGR